MNKMKNQDLKQKIFQFSLWLLLYSLMILATDAFMQASRNRKDAIRERISSIENDIYQMRSLKNEFLLRYQLEENNIVTETAKIESEFSSLFTKVLNESAYIGDLRTTRKDSAINSALGSLKSSLESFGRNAQTLFLAIKERGNAGTGVTSQWLALSSKMSDYFQTADDEILGRLMQVKRLEADYLQAFNSRDLENIETICDEVLAGFTNRQNEDIGSAMNEYITLTGIITKINNRIQSPTGEGLARDTDNAVDEALISQAFLGSLLVYNNTFYTIAGYALIGMLFSLLIFMLFRSSGRIFIGPLNKAISFVGDISRGQIKNRELELDQTTEFNNLAEKLNNIVSDLTAKYEFAKALNENNFSADLNIKDEKDYLGNELLEVKRKIVETTTEQTRNNEDNMRRRYINEGLAKFAGILRANNNLKVMGDNFIRNAVKYLGAIQGGLFILNNARGKPVLNLISSFAYDRKKFLQKDIEIGEGLVGTCAVEKKTINLTEVPEGYISITSGLGDTPPDNLLLVPVLHENELLGVLEIASLKKFLDYEITFADEVAKSLGATIIYTRNSEITSSLLKTSQQQALEMAEQEEEMRQNMEELKATQEESSRREGEYYGVIRALEKSIYVIEYNPETGAISDINDMLCEMLGIRKSEITGKNHHQVFCGSLKTDKKFWERVSLANSLIMTEIIDIKGKKIKLQEYFSAVVNSEGVPLKYINFAVPLELT